MAETRIDTSDGFKKAQADSEIEARIARHCEKYGIDPLTAVKNFAVLARRQALKRFLAHVELFKMTLDVPGDIAEFGVFRGLGLFTWANLLESYCIGDRTKVVYGFDNWQGFTGFSEQDSVPLAEAGKTVGGFNPARFHEEVLDAIGIFDSDRFIPSKPRIKLIDGNIEENVVKFARDNPGVRFSLVHLDCDLYKPTHAVLQAIWDKVTRGGVVIFDEYAIADWPGETAAVDEFLADKPGVRLRTFSWTNVPGAFLIKS
jgi:dTDP-rhamnose C3-O-methyltransferase